MIYPFWKAHVGRLQRVQLRFIHRNILNHLKSLDREFLPIIRALFMLPGHPEMFGMARFCSVLEPSKVEFQSGRRTLSP